MITTAYELDLIKVSMGNIKFTCRFVWKSNHARLFQSILLNSFFITCDSHKSVHIVDSNLISFIFVLFYKITLELFQ